MKRIIGGKTYNTETAAKIAMRNDDPRDAGYDDIVEGEILYQTRHGAYFLLYYNEISPEDDALIPLAPQEAQSWMEKYASVELIEQHFGEMPEAGDSESRLTLRMPDSLKQRIDLLAGKNNQSTNAWIVRALEKVIAYEKG